MANADFAARSFGFAARIIRLFQALPKDEVSRTLGRQLLRSGTSVGANARAAKRARSRAEFVAKMGIVEEEADESIYWIDLLVEVGLLKPKRIEALRIECEEILSITVASIKTARTNARTKT
ncbi:MAG: four helix bundle protein [Chthoniobacteraceae bacterium]